MSSGFPLPVFVGKRRRVVCELIMSALIPDLSFYCLRLATAWIEGKYEKLLSSALEGGSVGRCTLYIECLLAVKPVPSIFFCTGSIIELVFFEPE